MIPNIFKAERPIISTAAGDTDLVAMERL